MKHAKIPLLACAAAFCLSAFAGDLVLIENGQPKASIVIAKDAPYANRLAASELRHFLKKMSGAELPVVTDESDVPGVKILIGLNRYTREMDLKLPQGFSLDEIREEYLVRRSGENLILAGNDTAEDVPADAKAAARLAKQREANPYNLGAKPWYRGSLFAVYDFLTSLGCRWYFPGEIGEVVPKKATVTVANPDRRVKPGFLLHGYWQKPGFKDKEKGLNADVDLAAFYNRNRYISYDVGYPSAKDGSIMRPFRSPELFDAHPEYFALASDGKTRQKHILCMSNPEVIRIVAEDAMKFFETNPDASFAGYAPVDGMPACWCENCRRENGAFMALNQWDCSSFPCVSGTYYHLINEVAKEVGKKYPGKIIGASIYAGRILPPPTYQKLEPNVAGCIALIEYTLMHPVDDPANWESAQIRSLLKSWKSRVNYLTYRPYYPSFMVHCGLPIPLWRNTVRDVKFLAENKIHGFKWEGWPSFNTGLIDYYLRSRMIWEPGLDGEEVLDEFFRTFYGPAAEPVKKFYSALENAVVNAKFNSHEEELLRELYTVKLLDSIMPLADEAEKAVASAPEEYKKRVALFCLTADHVNAYAHMRDEAERQYDFKRAAELAQVMTEKEDAMLQLCPAFFFPGHRKYDLSRLNGKFPTARFNGNFTASGKRVQYENIQKLTDGTEGRRIMNLPRVWKFRTDSINEGISAQWYVPETDLSDWKEIEIGRSIELQGYFSDEKRLLPYLGEAWYAVDFDTDGATFNPDASALYSGGVNNEAWFWLNGVLIGYQKFHAWWNRGEYTKLFDIPKGVLKKGRNRMTVRVTCGDRFGFGGIFRGMFLYEKTGAAQ